MIRADLEMPPPRIAALPVSESGYPVPWFVAWVNGAPEFRAADPNKLALAIRDRRCWVCGELLTKWLTFPVGPMCCINRTSGEPPSHLECAQWSARNCLFLNGKKQKRREDEALAAIAQQPPGFMIRRQPGVVALWKCRDYQLFGDGRGGVLFRMGEPTGGIEWYAEGRQATRAEIEESVRTGLPILQGAAEQDGEEAVCELRRYIERFWNLVVAEAAHA